MPTAPFGGQRIIELAAKQKGKKADKASKPSAKPAAKKTMSKKPKAKLVK